ncbi:hypothetical protein TRIUR3_30631 [Triticum urartu]|uniref:Uncharacterized protein n=1 Tax=Triticum urartu TaxID=4572 RepID=M7ZMW4_TRIUA|nr:hypothetical protein TRIUR3_30631 [Triticum urartu]
MVATPWFAGRKRRCSGATGMDGGDGLASQNDGTTTKEGVAGGAFGAARLEVWAPQRGGDVAPVVEAEQRERLQGHRVCRGDDAMATVGLAVEAMDEGGELGDRDRAGETGDRVDGVLAARGEKIERWVQGCELGLARESDWA